jgi:hypothetical protein
MVLRFAQSERNKDRGSLLWTIDDGELTPEQIHKAQILPTVLQSEQ